jgi:hypothetical protein
LGSCKRCKVVFWCDFSALKVIHELKNVENCA